MAQTLSKMYFLLTSISGVFLGMNCILFLFCVYVLWGPKSQSRREVINSQVILRSSYQIFFRLLLFASIVQFCLCLAQMVFFIADLITAFTLYPDGAESYFLHINDYSLPCYIIYTLNYAIEGFLLIWRIYVLYNNNIMICVPSIILLALQVGLGGATAKGFAKEGDVTGSLQVFNLVTWALIAAVNVSATILICLRLWIAHRRANSILSQSKYKSTIVIVVECGALVTISTIAMLILYATMHPLGIAGLGITTQVATMAPLLIIARHGVLSRRDECRKFASQIPLRISVTRTEDTRVDIQVPLVSSKRKNSRLLGPLPELAAGNHPKPFCDA
ncbi:hypothetical protein HD554DRAFT_2166537 [Boletus coccyginus]|nr:hypothetical protein HD554DRAFT_2166537 [Boletus coccyginus]